MRNTSNLFWFLVIETSSEVVVKQRSGQRKKDAMMQVLTAENRRNAEIHIKPHGRLIVSD